LLIFFGFIFLKNWLQFLRILIKKDYRKNFYFPAPVGVDKIKKLHRQIRGA
jgi:hypothetical protein